MTPAFHKQLAAAMGIPADEQRVLDAGSDHPYSCRCQTCRLWWLAMGPDGGEEGNYGPFTEDEINTVQPTKDKPMSALDELGITREDILERCCEKILERDEDHESLFTQVRKATVALMMERAETKIDAILSEALANLCDAPFTPVDEWGQARGKTTTLRELIKAKSVTFLQDKVGSDGKPNTYQSVGTRAEWFAQQAVKEGITWEIKQEIGKAVEVAKARVKRDIADYITTLMMK